MPAKLSYEPSVQAVAREVIPEASLIAPDVSALRRRVSWPVTARSTGLGRLEGGEIVLVPSTRKSEIAARSADLVREGVVMAIFAGEVRNEDLRALHASKLPVATIPDDTDLGELRAELERFIARRRRDLFSLDGELHRTLIEASIAGAALRDLLESAARHSRSIAFLERDGELVVAPAGETVPIELVQLVRAAAGQLEGTPTLIDGARQVLGSAVMSGHDLRGVVGLAGIDPRELDALEAIIVNLASACAITLSREPIQQLPSLADVESQPSPGLLEGGPWIGVAMHYPSGSVERLQRAFAAELEARGARHVLISERNTPVFLASVDDRFPWESVVTAAALRLASTDLRVGMSRHQASGRAAREAVRQSLEALSRGTNDRVTRYESVELDALLGSLQGADAFLRGRLEPLLDGASTSNELLLTLATYLRTGRNAKEAARRLSVHRNTLTYRLRRLEDILQIEWEDADTVFALDLALRLRMRASIGADRNDSRSK